LPGAGGPKSDRSGSGSDRSQKSYENAKAPQEEILRKNPHALSEEHVYLNAEKLGLWSNDMQGRVEQMTTQMTTPTIQLKDNITGRDGFILVQALAYAIALIDALPLQHRPLTNQRDMKRLLDHMLANPRDVAILQGEAQRRVKLLMGSQE
jgi:hypothetical protein